MIIFLIFFWVIMEKEEVYFGCCEEVIGFLDIFKVFFIWLLLLSLDWDLRKGFLFGVVWVLSFELDFFKVKFCCFIFRISGL